MKVLPPRLQDPLRFAWIVIALSIVGFYLAPYPLASGFAAEQLALLRIPLLLEPILVLPLLLILPVRRTNAFYLRSFQEDEATGAVRAALQKGLGRGFRLSGIRAPARRTSTFWKHATHLAYCFKYSTPKFMNLEAGRYWLASVWRSLADARCAFIDLTEVTENVAIESRVAISCLGSNRIVFLADQTRDEAELRKRAAALVGLEEEAGSRLLLLRFERRHDWDARGLTQAVERFRLSIPKQRAGYQSGDMGLSRGMFRPAGFCSKRGFSNGLLHCPVLPRSLSLLD
jgi:hypothetical protein